VIEHTWVVEHWGQESEVVWDDVSLMLFGPALITVRAHELVKAGEVVYVTPVGPRVVASLDDELAAWATISQAIEDSGYELVGGSEPPMQPEMELEDNPTSE